ncbi:DUF397 domain-containing protein [Pseudonocardia phyllosphaerae]|uniref:DUF397 domain-containing protein n=1 Tax=Pseudonocardia phyllosphaerae TaxID=3390502 RepID=UPI00397CE36C
MTSSFCTRGECVEVAVSPGQVVVRATGGADSVAFTDDEWSAFVLGVKGGEFDLETLRR